MAKKKEIHFFVLISHKPCKFSSPCEWKQPVPPKREKTPYPKRLNNTTYYHLFNTIVKSLKFKTGSSLRYVIRFQYRIKFLSHTRVLWWTVFRGAVVKNRFYRAMYNKRNYFCCEIKADPLHQAVKNLIFNWMFLHVQVW